MPSLLEAQRAFVRELDVAKDAGMRAYRANTLGNQTAALAGVYPVVQKIVGGEFFEALARAYGLAFPSASGDLNEYGALLASFVSSFPQTLDLPYLPDVARLEWLVHRAYFADDPPLFDAASLAGTEPDAWRLRLAPACALIASDWPLARLWAAHQDGCEDAGAVDLAAGGERVLVCRPGWRAEVYALGAGEFRFLRAVEDGARLADALGAAAAEDAAFDAGTTPARYVELGVIIL